jgi:hypothetical protein
MIILLALLAVPGIAAVLLRWWHAAFGATRYSLERLVASQIAGRRAERGDISGLSEAEQVRQRARERQWRGLLRVAFWSAVLVVPLALPGTLIIYALYSFLWLVPRQRAKGEAS